ncbi:unnamed protein product [Mytilus coruscus]|uniref:SWIM-type domain-containing protein n=1 Tax=Mytilus coruscus TaxID=42192 RepID=A0A6J8F1P3_MYTCO|nr:unnamed protein product [Mytilus coruscus]
MSDEEEIVGSGSDFVGSDDEGKSVEALEFKLQTILQEKEKLEKQKKKDELLSKIKQAETALSNLQTSAEPSKSEIDSWTADDIKHFFRRKGIVVKNKPLDNLRKLAKSVIDSRIPDHKATTPSEISKRTINKNGKDLTFPGITDKSLSLWSDNISSFPSVQYVQAYAYILSSAEFDLDRLKNIQKDRFLLHKGNAIKKIKVHKLDEGFCYVTCSCMSCHNSQKNSEVVWSLIQNDGCIQTAGCSCDERIDCCKHAMALLLTLASFNKSNTYAAEKVHKVEKGTQIYSNQTLSKLGHDDDEIGKQSFSGGTFFTKEVKVPRPNDTLYKYPSDVSEEEMDIDSEVRIPHESFGNKTQKGNSLNNPYSRLTDISKPIDISQNNSAFCHLKCDILGKGNLDTNPLHYNLNKRKDAAKQSHNIKDIANGDETATHHLKSKFEDKQNKSTIVTIENVEAKHQSAINEGRDIQLNFKVQQNVKEIERQRPELFTLCPVKTVVTMENSSDRKEIQPTITNQPEFSVQRKSRNSISQKSNYSIEGGHNVPVPIAQSQIFATRKKCSTESALLISKSKIQESTLTNESPFKIDLLMPSTQNPDDSSNTKPPIPYREKVFTDLKEHSSTRVGRKEYGIISNLQGTVLSSNTKLDTGNDEMILNNVLVNEIDRDMPYKRTVNTEKLPVNTSIKTSTLSKASSLWPSTYPTAMFLPPDSSLNASSPSLHSSTYPTSSFSPPDSSSNASRSSLHSGKYPTVMFLPPDSGSIASRSLLHSETYPTAKFLPPDSSSNASRSSLHSSTYPTSTFLPPDSSSNASRSSLHSGTYPTAMVLPQDSSSNASRSSLHSGTNQTYILLPPDSRSMASHSSLHSGKYSTVMFLPPDASSMASSSSINSGTNPTAMFLPPDSSSNASSSSLHSGTNRTSTLLPPGSSSNAAHSSLFSGTFPTSMFLTLDSSSIASRSSQHYDTYPTAMFLPPNSSSNALRSSFHSGSYPTATFLPPDSSSNISRSSLHSGTYPTSTFLPPDSSSNALRSSLHSGTYPTAMVLLPDSSSNASSSSLHSGTNPTSTFLPPDSSSNSSHSSLHSGKYPTVMFLPPNSSSNASSSSVHSGTNPTVMFLPPGSSPNALRSSLHSGSYPTAIFSPPDSSSNASSSALHSGKCPKVMFLPTGSSSMASSSSLHSGTYPTAMVLPPDSSSNKSFSSPLVYPALSTHSSNVENKQCVDTRDVDDNAKFDTNPDVKKPKVNRRDRFKASPQTLEENSRALKSSTINRCSSQQPVAATKAQKITYDRTFLLQLRKSVLSQRRPENIGDISEIQVDSNDETPVTYRSFILTPGYVKGVKKTKPKPATDRHVVRYKTIRNSLPDDDPHPNVVSIQLQMTTEEMMRKVISAINMVKHGCDSSMVVKVISDLHVNTEDALIRIVNLVVDTAIDEPSCLSVCTSLCRTLARAKVQSRNDPGESVTFSNAYRQKCTKEIEQGILSRSTESYNRRIEEIARFTGIIARLTLLKTSDIHAILMKFAQTTSEHCLECFCTLLTDVWERMEKCTSANYLDQYYEVIDEVLLYSETNAALKYKLGQLKSKRRF